MNIEKEIRFIDLFGGVGGFRIGLERCNDIVSQSSDERSKTRRKWSTVKQRTQFYNRQDSTFSCVWYADIDKYATAVYNYRFKESHSPADIRQVKTCDIPDFDMLCAGFPCQSFSIAGKRGGFKDTRGTLFFEICRIARDKRPSILFLENVKGLLSHDEGQTFRVILSSLDELGYDVEWQVLNSKHFGVPQNRERVFIIGHLRGQPRFQVFPIGTTYQKSHKQTENQQKTRGVRIDKEEWNIDSNKLPILENGERRHIPLRIRRLTPRECERLQGFPDDWTLIPWQNRMMSDTQRYKMMGNAVTVNVIEAIGKRIIESYTTIKL